MVSRAPVLAILCPLLSGLVLACGDDGGGTTGATADTSGTASTADATTSDTTGTTGTTAEPTTTAATTGTSEGTTTGTSGPGTTTGTTTDATTDATTGGGIDCAAIPMGPFEPVYLGGGFNGSEDLGFDGAGGLALKGGDQVVIATAPDLQYALLASGLPQTYGTRFAINGDLLVALPNQGKLQAIDADGAITDVAAGLQGPNGLYVDPSGAIWVTEFAGSRVLHFTPDYVKTTVYEGPEAASANGVVLDPARGLLFFTNYGAGRLLKIAVDDQGQAMGAPEQVGAVQGAKLDGLALDVCGNVYAVDQGNSRLYRFWLDDQAAIVGAPELLAEFPDNVANAQFGRGGGWEPDSLYLSGNPGEIYALPVGVPGAPIGLPG